MEADTFDLEERTARFGEDIVQLSKGIPYDRINDVLIKQVVRSGTSVGANYMEADSAASRKDFRHKIILCQKEARETKHWIRMIAKANPKLKEQCRELWQEAHELTKIFSSIALSVE